MSSDQAIGRLNLMLAAFFAVAPVLICSSIVGEPFDLVKPFCVLLVVELVWAIWSWREATGSLLDPYLAFFIMAALFNAGEALLQIFGTNEQGFLGDRFSPLEVLRTLSLVISVLGALHLGALLAFRHGSVGRVQALSRTTSGPHDDGALLPLRICGWLLGAIAVGPLAQVMRESIRKALVGGYLALYANDQAVGAGSALLILADYAIPAALLLMVGYRGRSWAWLALLVLLAYSSCLLFLGSRANAVLPLLSAVWLWNRTVRPLPRIPLLAVGALLLLVVFPLINRTRAVSGSERMSASYLQDAFSSVEHPLVDILAEAAGTMGTVAETLRLVPASHPYELGEGYAYAALTVVPSLFWDRHPSIARGTPGAWLTETLDPDEASRGGSFGYSFIAETYLNFGWAGGLVALLIGFGFVRLWLWAESRGPAALVLVASFLPSLLFFSRGDASMLPRPLLWYCLGPYALVRLIESRLRQRQATSGLSRPGATRDPSGLG